MVQILNQNQVDDVKLQYAVIVSRYKKRWIFVKHKERDTLEIPGGHREDNEIIIQTAERELYEETGAVKYRIEPVSAYQVKKDDETSYGLLYYADIFELEELPESEIAEIQFFDECPDNLTYPKIQPILYHKVMEYVNADDQEIER